jgi:hypothetical protein
MINIMWSVLNRGMTCPTGRQVSAEAYTLVDKYNVLHNTLVPGADVIYSSCCSEQLLQAILNSSYKDRLNSLDVLNTYEYPLAFPRALSTMTVSTAPVTVTILKDGSAFKWVAAEFNIYVNPTASTASVTGLGKKKDYVYSITDNLTSKIPLDVGLYMRMTGPLPAVPFNVNVKCEVPFTRNLTEILIPVESVTWYNAEYKKAYSAEVNPAEKAAILTFNLYEGITNG